MFRHSLLIFAAILGAQAAPAPTPSPTSAAVPTPAATPTPAAPPGAMTAPGLTGSPVPSAIPAQAPASVTIATKISTASPKTPALLQLSRTGDASGTLVVNISFLGSAIYGVDYPAVTKTVTLPPGAKSVDLPIPVTKNASGETAKTIAVKVVAGPGYIVGPSGIANIEIARAGPVLFVAALRPTKTATDSTAYGTATLLLAENGASAKVAVSYSNLTSTKVSSHLKLGEPATDGRYIINFYGDQQPINFEWDLHATGDLSEDDLQKALEAGLIYVAIDTKHYPTGELRGQFIRSTGSTRFTPPPAPPGLPGGPPTPTDAARFLIQATFGPTKTEIDDLTHKNLNQWIAEQMAQPASSHLALTRLDYQQFPRTTSKPKVGNNNRQAAWWKIALTAPDQLRQRVAFALSEIFVVSDVNDILAGNPEALANYYDILSRDAFGNFRDLLNDVTFSPIMGSYLSHLKNAKADPVRGISPDENYAREVMQLFTIGLNELQPDGTLRLDRNGLPIPTYDQDTIVATARVFTGLGFYSAEPKPNFRGARQNYFAPMMLYPDFHDDGAKVIVGGVKVPANEGAAADLKLTLDTLYHHANLAPFICRQLIQRLVTSNPSPGYVYRVSQVFARNAAGERGDLGAVVRAILLDYEARSPAVTANFGYGKLKEPLLRVTALLRAFDGSAKNGRYYIPNPEGPLGEAALRSTTVFNFFEPDYVLPGTLAAAGLHAPEYQIFTATTAITVPNHLQSYIYTGAQPSDGTLTLKLDPLLALARNPDGLLDYLNLNLCGGALSARTRESIYKVLADIPPTTGDLERARTALQLVVTSTDCAIQR